MGITIFFHAEFGFATHLARKIFARKFVKIRAREFIKIRALKFLHENSTTKELSEENFLERNFWSERNFGQRKFEKT